jgi:ribosomal protein S18 acetylase RimI-like enzyme
VTAQAPTPLDLERLTARAWRATREETLGGWRLNAALGVSGRINSCWPLGDPGFAAEAAIARVEAWYADQGLPPVFKVATDAMWPGDLPARLAARGYQPDTETLLMTAPLRNVTQAGVRLEDDPDAAFAQVFAGTAPNLDDARERLEALARTPRPRAFARIDVSGVPVAIGACAIETPWVGIFAMRTLPDFRRQGLAARILAALLVRASDQGATRAWLQVEAANLGAVRLYEGTGFRTFYSYSYWRRR